MPLRRIRVVDLVREVGDSIDLFLCCGSFESRSLSAGLSLIPDGVKFAIVAEHEDFHRHVAANTAKLKAHFGSASEILKLDTRSPIRSADRLAECLRKVPGPYPKRILFDTTTFTHETLIIAAEVILRTFGELGQLKCVYTIADEYDPGQPDDVKWLSKGISEIRSVLGFPGAILPGRGLHLVLLHGFEEERSKSLIARYEPDVLSLGTPLVNSYTAARHSGRNLRVHEEILRYAQIAVSEVNEFDFCATDHFECRDAILKQAEIKTGFNTVVAPMNTKISTLGVMLAGRANERIQICYVQPSTYNVDNYSRPSDELYVFDLAVPR